jgi:hypothetical protein
LHIQIQLDLWWGYIPSKPIVLVENIIHPKCIGST